jgi:large subunit ribosomal protein L4
VGFLQGLGLKGRSTLIVLEESHRPTLKSFRNIPGTTVLSRSNINVFEVLKNDVLIITQKALEGLPAGASK